MQSLECVELFFVCFIAKNECARHYKSGFTYITFTPFQDAGFSLKEVKIWTAATGREHS